VTIPGPRSAAATARLKAREQRNVTFVSDDLPIVWESASGATVRDVDGNEYIDCTAAFGVTNTGHCNAYVADAVAAQAHRLMHGMGDVHPNATKIELLERLAEILPPSLERTFLATTGSEAVEAALKTAVLATGKSRFAAFRGGYHGLSIGTLGVGGIERFRRPFAALLAREPLLLEFPRAAPGVDARSAAGEADDLLARDDIAALIVEPIQGRAGAVVPPAGYLAELRRVCDRRGIVMIVDEIYTGFGRTGDWFAIDADAIVPDILCIGKAFGSGVPISAAVGTASVMDAWPHSTGEALHTSTYLGNPLGCAAALATIEELRRHALPERAERLGRDLGERLTSLLRFEHVVDVRGRGLLWGVQLVDAPRAAATVGRALRGGVILLQSGVDGDVVTIAPPLIIEEAALHRAVETLSAAIEEQR
jgi:4-aminobutyrate aminotransferase-like enzyme